MNYFLLALVASASIACTSVRLTDDDDDGDGKGGSPSSVGGGTESGSGGGGGLPSCKPGELLRAGDLQEVPLGEADEQAFPRMVQLASGQVLLAVTADAVDGGFPHSPALTVLDPWGAWPPAIEAPTILPYGTNAWTAVGTLDGEAYLITSTSDGSYLFPDLPDNPDAAVLIAPDPVDYIHFAPSSEGSVLLRTDGSNGAVVTSAWPAGSSESLPASCVEADLAAAVPVPGGFLVAERFATFEEGVCPSSDVDLLITRYAVAAGGELVREVAQAIPVGPFGMGRLIERSDGAWLLIQSDLPGEPPYSVRRLDVNGLTASEPVEIPLSGGLSGTGRFGDGFALARFNPESEYGLVLELFGADGALLKTASFDDAPVFVGGAAQILPSPDGASLLVAFFGYVADEKRRTVVARFDCAD